MEIRWISPKDCGRNITLVAQSGGFVTCDTFGQTYGVPSTSLPANNEDISCGALNNSTYCVPLACQTAFHGIDGGQSMHELIQAGGPYANVSELLFMRWNPAVDYNFISADERFCIG